MDVGTRASTGAANQAYDLSSFNSITLLHKTFFQMGILCYKPVSMVNQNIPAISSIIVLFFYYAIGCNFDIRSCPSPISTPW
jgi:hypothetical protein